MQKNLLSSFFKEGKNCILKSQRGRGVKTAFLAIAIYYKLKYNKKSILISKDDSFISDFFSNYFDIYSSEPSNISDYEFAVYYNLLPVNYKGRSVIFSREKAEFKDFKYIEDEFKISSSVLILEENSLSEYEKKPVFIYSKHLPILEKTEFKKNMSKYEKIVSDRSILALF